eukprot:TRINITY_DN11692_c0_g1_i1.p2 TRINITY_DN11692_c0_g1~~TRINITY_DN11692_c0_g1_i1.p2  ORF type:complete len:116 (-),score=8.89 TRINITY_DN11692_c0_g1_i1:65-412(-)
MRLNMVMFLVVACALPSVTWAQAGCCDCSRRDGSECRDGLAKHKRKRSFCTEQTTEVACSSAGGRSTWVGAGTCRWSCRSGASSSSSGPVPPPPPPVPPVPPSAETKLDGKRGDL